MGIIERDHFEKVIGVTKRETLDESEKQDAFSPNSTTLSSLKYAEY